MSEPRPPLILGGTGLIGFHIGQAWLRRGVRPRVAARDVVRGQGLWGAAADVLHADLTQPATLAAAVQGCEMVFHAAGPAEQWFKDPGVFHRTHVEGTRHLVQACIAAGVKRLVFLSTIDVFEPDTQGVITEHCARRTVARSPYEAAKQAADAWLSNPAHLGGLEVVFLHPCATYGPGPARSRGTNDFVRELRDGQIPILVPGGVPLVYAADVGEAAVRAALQAQPGDRFVLAERWLSLQDLARQTLALLGPGGRRRVPPVLPLSLARGVSQLTEAWARLTGTAPLVPRGQLQALQWGARPRAALAQARLELRFTPLETGLAALLEALPH